MAYRDYRVVVWVPYGRKLTVEILTRYLYANKDIVDEVWLCMNTDEDQEEDRAFAYNLAKSDPDFYKVKEIPLKKGEKHAQKWKTPGPKQRNTGKFYRYMTDTDTIYIRMDDDMVYVDDQFFPNFLDFRIDHPEFFVVFANIWNNSMISYMHQNIYGNIDETEGVVTQPFAMDPVGWMSPTFAEHIHRILLKHIEDGTTSKLFFDYFELDDKRRFSVSCFAHFGKDFAQFDGDLGDEEEEQWITEVYTKENDITNAVCGSALISHFAFFAQRPHLLYNTDILQQYEQVSLKKLSDSYYKLLKLANDKEQN